MRLVGLLLAALLGVVAALWTWTRSGDLDLAPVAADRPGVTLHILDNGFHTDLAVPRRALEARDGPLAEAVRALPPGEWILVGWGDARFYVDTTPIHTRLPDGARAFFWPGNASVVMLDPDPRDPARIPAAEGRAEVRVGPQGFDRLADRVEASLAPGPEIGARRPGDDMVFLKSTETFWIGHLCNHWTAEVLSAGGVAVRPLRSVTSGEVMRAVEAADAG
ncbi:DUF2459 domain-containing protein [Brevundimonas sp.]|uniref:DUF2459 domain-containing protein n=1 Tax=Brevundimonas sp. TaxID=1871086 RepID=UPI0035ADFDEE